MMNREGLSSLRSPALPTGVLADQELLLGGIVAGKPRLQARVLPWEARTLAGLLNYLWEQEVTTVWVLPTSSLSREITTARLLQESDRWTCLPHTASPTSERPSCALFFPRQAHQAAGRRMTLAFPAHAGWHWQLPDALSLLATATYLEQLLSRQLVDTPQQCAANLLADLTLREPVNDQHPSALGLGSLPNQHGSPVPFLQGTSALSWKRPLALAEGRLRYLHKYTYFSRTLPACLDVPLGEGKVQFSPTGRACDGKRPGIWRARLARGGSLFDGKVLPSCLGQEWMSTPLLNCCRTIGYEVQVQEGYYWPQSHQRLAPWASFLWKAGERLATQPQRFRHPQARANACHTLQELAAHVVAGFAEPAAPGGSARPDWYAQIMGRARGLLFADLARLVRGGTVPVLLHGDAFWTVSANPDPLTAVPGLFTKQRWSGYAPGYDVPLFLSRTVQELLSSDESPEEIVSALERQAWERLPEEGEG